MYVTQFLSLWMFINLAVSAAIPSSRRTIVNYECPKTNLVKVAFFDADNTLRVSQSGKPSANHAEDVYLLPFVAKKIGELYQSGEYLLAIVSNQGGVPKFVSFKESEAALIKTAKLASSDHGGFHYLDMATDLDDANTRKPETQMAHILLEKLQTYCANEKLKLDLKNSYMVGDAGYKKGVDGPHPDGRPADDFSNSDRLFAENLEVKFYEPQEYFGWREYGIYNFSDKVDLFSFMNFIDAESRYLKSEGLDLDRAKALGDEAALLRKQNPIHDSFSYTHYNIRELTTEKILSSSDVQYQQALSTLKVLTSDFLSINELQYDKEATPGLNFERILNDLGLNWNFTFAEALTGRLVGTTNGPKSDPVNFGVMPGQYSTAFGSRFPIVNRLIYPQVPADPNVALPKKFQIRWIDWDPNSNPSQFEQLDGIPLPSDMDLFDKNFSDSVVNIQGKAVHFITFHTVPAFNFDNPKGPNLVRNSAQLEFMSWYLTGVCEPNSQSKVKSCKATVRPLSEQEENPSFIAVGDLNVDLHSDKPGAAVLNQLYKSGKIHTKLPINYDPKFSSQEDKISHVTYSTYGHDLGRLQEQLDYFLVSKNLRLDSLFVYHPMSFFEHGKCFPSKSEAQTAIPAFSKIHPKLSSSVSQRSKKEFCLIGVSKAFERFRKGSDHYPVVLNFSF